MDRSTSKTQIFSINGSPEISGNPFSSELLDLSDDVEHAEGESAAQGSWSMEHLDISVPARLSSFDESRTSIDQSDTQLRRQVAEALKAELYVTLHCFSPST